MKRNKLWVATCVVVLFATLPLFFQNCAQTQFGSSSSSSANGGGNNGIQGLPSSLSFSVQPGKLDFGQVLLNTNSSLDVTVTNSSTDPIDLDIPLLTVGAYTVDASTCATLASGASCLIHVTFKPGIVAPPDGNLVVNASSSGTALPNQNVALTGTGFFIPPSSADKIALVGWYSYKQPSKLTFTQSGATANCPAVSSSLGHGQVGEYCYEPSGANGMYFGDATKFPTLTQYILQAGASLNTNVTTLDQLFPLASDKVSNNICFQEGLFYYALSYLIIPSNQDVTDPNFDVRFSLSNVDDGVQLISNGVIMGNDFLGQAANFSLHRKGTTPVLTNGANTLAALWVDDCQVSRYITGAQVLYNGNPFTPLEPNVMRGYLYSKQDGSVYSSATVNVTDAAGAVQSVQTDGNGFFQLSGIASGTAAVAVTVGSTTRTENVNFDYHSAATAIVDFSRGY